MQRKIDDYEFQNQNKQGCIVKLCVKNVEE